MISLTLLIGILGLLFVMAYATNRRFGVLGLGLAAGALLSANWASTVTPFIQQQGITMVSPPLLLVVQSALIILPPTVLLFSGPRYKGKWPRIAGAFGFALLAFAFLVVPLGAMLQFDEPGLTVFDFVRNYASLIIVVGLCAAVADMLLTGQPRSKKREH